MLRAWLKEPLIHFLFLGGLVFALYSAVGEEESRDTQITLKANEITRLLSEWQRRWGREAEPENIDGIIAARIREEVLLREALELGLDQNDPAIRRRMAQKMEFMIEGTTEIQDPDEATLQTYLEAHSERYLRPASYRFNQVFFSTDARGNATTNDAKEHLMKYGAGDETADMPQVDRFPNTSPAVGNLLNENTIVRNFGQAFADSLAGLELNRWQGPISSAFGSHLVRIEKHEPAQLPALDEIHEIVRVDWRASEMRRLNDQSYQRLLKRYSLAVELPESVTGYEFSGSPDS